MKFQLFNCHYRHEGVGLASKKITAFITGDLILLVRTDICSKSNSVGISQYNIIDTYIPYLPPPPNCVCVQIRVNAIASVCSGEPI